MTGPQVLVSSSDSGPDVSNTTKRASAEMRGLLLGRVFCSPDVRTLTRSIAPESRSFTKTSATALVSPGTRFVAVDQNATKRPSPLICGWLLEPAAAVPSLAALTRVTCWADTGFVASSTPPSSAIDTDALTLRVE